MQKTGIDWARNGMAIDADAPYCGYFVAGQHRYAVRVYYEDTDAGGVVYHANFLRFFERARSDMLALAGIDHLAVLAELGQGYVVSEANLRYLAPARLGDALVIVSRPEAIRAASCVIQQRVIRNDAVIVDGRITLAFVSADGRPRRQPPEWLVAMRAIAGEDGA